MLENFANLISMLKKKIKKNDMRGPRVSGVLHTSEEPGLSVIKSTLGSQRCFSASPHPPT